MVRIRKTYRRKPTRKYGKRMTRRMATIKRAPRSNYLTTKMTTYYQTWTWGTAATSDFWRYHISVPSQWNGFADLANVFDEYKVNAIKYTFRGRYDTTDASGAVPIADMTYIVDPASTVIPSGAYGGSSYATLLQNNPKTRRLTSPISIYFKPKMGMQVMGGATNVAEISPKFLKTNDTSVDYRGLHTYVLQNGFTSVASNIIIDTYVTVYATFRNMK